MEEFSSQGGPQPTLWFLVGFLCLLKVHQSAGAWETILIPQVADELILKHCNDMERGH